MKLSRLNELPTSREMIDVFGGYNHNLRIGEGEFYDMKNLTSADYPVLSPRHKRGIYDTPNNPQGMVAKDALCYVDGSDFVMNEYRVDMGLSIDNTPKTLISMGAYVIIMPDKKYINTKKLSDFGDIEKSFTTSSQIRFRLSRPDGLTGEGEGVLVGSTAPADPNYQSWWIDTSSIPHTLKMYSEANAEWTSIPTTYTQIISANIGKAFEVGDGITISGVENYPGLNTTTYITAKSDNHIIVPIAIDQLGTQDTPITIEKRMPLMDFVIESGNRLWGCRYGTAINGEVVNEIYASKLGDFTNWTCFQGVSTDSYAATVGTDGQFTGAITHLGFPIFFKENCMHKVYGNYPANFQIQTTTCRGVQQGCDRSLAIVNEVLYYKTRTGICAYDGSLPTEISSAFGDETYHSAVAGSLGNKYYVSMSDASGSWHLFVYDTKRGMWHREDETQVDEFCNCRGDLYFIDHADKQIKTVRGTGDALEPQEIQWEAITGSIGTDSPDKKYISRLDVRMSMTVGTRVYFYIDYDSTGKWEHLFTMTGRTLQSFTVPVRPRRCDHLRLKIIGSGEAKIYSICKTIEQGSER